ncbi:hypothetical protein [Halobacterium sp. KA-6]|uniref:hypothetical protein n=1 Tax=Halobacterium sp. KA-6 TaxID=2896368 RepID=UPI001E5FC9A0|nr:hypothetical protein [Halobacterium sp. KA-6]MCD2204167.1 hypothetical protein [Halobacterium sp. KA-6]
MDCVVCNRTGTAYRLVDERAAALGVCEQCVAEHLASAADDACVYCATAGGYDLVEDTSAVVASESQAERVVVTSGVVCHDHVGDLRRENA